MNKFEMKMRRSGHTGVLIIKSFFLGFLFLFLISCDGNSGSPEKPVEQEFNYLPTSTTGAVVKHKYYTLSYFEKYEQAEWVAYELRKDQIVYIHLDRPYFEQDPLVKTGSADWVNYKDSGYTKGHLLPAADRKFNITAYNETFLTSNISPQIYEFNAGIWLILEEQVRKWAERYDKLYIVTAGVLQPGLKTIGYEEVAVPEYFYKVILDYTEPEIKAIAFLIPHEESNRPLTDFVISIDDLEKLTHIDFFPELPDDLENKLESSTDYSKWKFDEIKIDF
jgi:endonuclease G